MKSIKLKCQVITPMFMAGADGRTPELRPSEFKGMMRWWWRAIKAEDDIEKLREEEAKIFGGTGKGQGKSKVKIVIDNYYPPTDFIGENISSEIIDKEGCKYLLYSTFALKVRGKPLIRKYIKTNYSFTIDLKAYDGESYRQALAALWLSIYLGGFGTRARRGGGNLIVEQVIEGDTEGIDFDCNVKNLDELEEWLKYNIEKIKEVTKQSIAGTNKYTNLNGGRILLFEHKKTWIEALDFLGNELMKFRKRKRNKNKIFETAAFGMPVMHSKFSVRMVPYSEKVNKKERLSDRWASSLIFKVIKSGRLYFPIVIKLSAGGVEFVGKELRVGEKWRLDDNQIQRFDENLVNDFLHQLPKSRELLL